MRWPTLDQLNSVWNGVLRDKTARVALERLKRDGFNIGDLSPKDPTFHSSSWADSIAAIPLLENRPSRTIFHHPVCLRKHLPLVRALRNFARQCDDPFCEKALISTGDMTILPDENSPNPAESAASFIEKFLSCHWYIRERNRRNALIAELRWAIRSRTGKPHDRELSTLIDAACRAAGCEELCLDNTTLERIEKREKDTRVKSVRRLKFHAGLSPTPGKSTRNRNKRP